MGQLQLEIFESCDDCENKIDSDTNYKNCDGESICKDCADNYIRCNDCGSIENKNDSYRYGDGHICGSCYDNHYATCEDCRTITHEDDIYSNEDGEVYCESCYNSHYVRCESCDTEIQTQSSNHYRSENNEDFCESCYHENYRRCEDCECEVYADDIVWSEDEEMELCGSCFNGRDNSSDLIHNYSYKPDPIFTGISKKENPFIGFEIEIETKSAKYDAAEIANELRNVYLKEDSSIDNGFEIVSHPSTIDNHLKDDFEAVFSKLRALGCRAHDTKTCGIHFHIEKHYLSSQDIDNILYFFSFNTKRIEAVSRRNSGRWAQYKKINKDEKKYCSHNHQERYQAVNINNKHTIEFRTFRSTLKTSTFLASLEFVFGVYRYCRRSTVNFEQLESWSQFVQYCKKLKLNNFITYLDERNIPKTDFIPRS